MADPVTAHQSVSQQISGQLASNVLSNIANTAQQKKGGTTWPKYEGIKSRRLGIVQIALSVLIVVSSCVGAPLHESIVSHGNLYTYGFGFWCPIFSIVSGSFAKQAEKVKTTAKLKKILGWSLASFFLVMGGVTSWSAVGIPNMLWDENDRNIRMGVVAILSVQMTAGLAVGITSIWLSKLAGDHVCCCKPNKASATVQYITTIHPDGSVTQQVWSTVASNSLQPGLLPSNFPLSGGMPPTGEHFAAPQYVSTDADAFDVSPPPYAVYPSGTEEDKSGSVVTKTYM